MYFSVDSEVKIRAEPLYNDISYFSLLHAEKFTFDQVLRAVHRNAIVATKLPDDDYIKVIVK